MNSFKWNSLILKLFFFLPLQSTATAHLQYTSYLCGREVRTYPGALGTVSIPVILSYKKGYSFAWCIVVINM